MKLNKIIFLFATISIISVKALAQGPLPADPDDSVPLDGGLTIALVAGISYGAKKLMKKKGTTADVTVKVTTEK